LVGFTHRKVVRYFQGKAKLLERVYWIYRLNPKASQNEVLCVSFFHIRSLVDACDRDFDFIIFSAIVIKYASTRA